MYKEVQTDMSHGDSVVRINNVTKTFSQWQRDNTRKGILRNLIKPEKRIITALDNVSFEIKKGDFVAYAGPNGAGKSTTMKLMSGMLIPVSGEISILGMSPQKDRKKLMRKLGVIFGNRTELWWDHPIIQSYEWKKIVWNIPDEEYKSNLEMVIELLEIGDLLKTFARELSLGQRMRADLGMMLLHSPELILLDEPTLGLDVVAKRQMIEFLKRINHDDDVTIVVTSHDMDDLEEMARRVLMISSGKIVYDGNFDGLRNITANLAKLIITMNNDSVPALQNGKIISAENGVYEFEVDVSKNPIKKLLLELSEINEIHDVQINKASIEHVIASLYREWK